MKNPTGYDGRGYSKGDRVELHPGTDLWMRGARYGEVVGVTKKGKVRVKVDKTGRVVSGDESRFKPLSGNPKRHGNTVRFNYKMRCKIRRKKKKGLLSGLGGWSKYAVPVIALGAAWWLMKGRA